MENDYLKSNIEAEETLREIEVNGVEFVFVNHPKGNDYL